MRIAPAHQASEIGLRSDGRSRYAAAALECSQTHRQTEPISYSRIAERTAISRQSAKRLIEEDLRPRSGLCAG